MSVELLHFAIDFAFITVWAIVGQIIVGDRRCREGSDAQSLGPAIIAGERTP